MIRLAVTNVYVDDQAKALAFYTGMLGFVVKRDIPVGPARWLTVVAPDDPDGVEILLEPNQSAIATAYQSALYEAGLPSHTVFITDDIKAQHARMVDAGVTFTMNPTMMGPATQAVFDDTCGNLIMLLQVDQD
ncbi:MAG: VOC family protein [Acidimicrobiia bacterium]